MSRTIVVGLSFLLAAGSLSPGSAQDLAGDSLCLDLWKRVPTPETGGLEDAVRDHLVEARSQTASVLDAAASLQIASAAVGDLALTYHAYGLLGAAGSAYGVARCLDTRDPVWPYARGRIAEDRGDLDEAEALYFEALRRESALPVLFRLAEIAMTRGDLARAELLYRQALEEPPSRTAALAALGQIALSRGENERAVELLEKALQAVPDAVRLHYPLALAHRRLGDHARAGEHLQLHGPVGVTARDPLQETLDGIPRGSRISTLRGRAALRANRPEEAMLLLESAVAADPTSSSSRIALAVAAFQAGDPERARAELETVLEQDPRNHTALFNLAVLELQAGNRDRARDLLQRALAERPEDEEILKLLE